MNTFSSNSNGKVEENAWRMWRIMGEFTQGFQTLSELPKSVAIFGSARTKPEDPYYQAAMGIAAAGVKHGFPVITGGGPGIMEAGNRGAADADGTSVGLCIKLPKEQGGNPWINCRVDFHYFFVRKVMFLKHTACVVCMPGGFGTMDELFEVATLVQTRKIPPMQIVLYGREFWGGLHVWLKEKMEDAHGYISHGDLDFIPICDSVAEVDQVFEKVRAELDGRPRQDSIFWSGV